MAESFARLLKRHRIAAGLSQERLAELAGVSSDAISALERGAHRAPYKATLDLLIAALALDDRARREIETAAKLARARGPQPQRHDGNNLPGQLTSFVDREREVAEIGQLLQAYRLVTVVGTGGAGKTRGAIKVATQVLDAYDDGVWLAELASISDPLLVTTVIARTLRVHEAPNRPTLDTLLAYLKRKRLLLILDNCEHVLDEARRVAAGILYGSPDVGILATSRESLSIAGEQVYHMPPLPVPSTSELISADEMSQYGATRLFRDRAVSADNRFTVTLETASHVAEICRRLDGIPLAIELAAARVKAISPTQLARSLDERFRVLTTGDRSVLPRHRTMRALIDWSYDLLSDDERRLFRKLSIFAGGFTLETAGAVGSDSDIDELGVIDLLSSLVDKSLVQTEPAMNVRRYRLLESTREYAREKLTDAGEEGAVAAAHAGAFLSLAEQLCDAWEATPDRVWSARAEPEVGNFRAALGWALGAQGDVLLGQRLAVSLAELWRYFPAEGRRWVQAAQQRVTAETPASVLAALDLREAVIAEALYQPKPSRLAAERALARYRELDDPWGIVHAETHIGREQIFHGEIAEGEALTLQALEAARALGGRKSVIRALQNLGIARQFAGDLPGARQRYGEALAAARAVGAQRLAASIALDLAETEFRGGEAAAALGYTDEALAVFGRLGAGSFATVAQCNIAAYLVAMSRFDEALIAARDVIAPARDTQKSASLAFALQHLGAIAALRPNADVSVMVDRHRAARILGYVDARLSALQLLREYTEQQEYDRMLPSLRGALSEDELEKLMAEGSTWSEDQAVSEAMLI